MVGRLKLLLGAGSTTKTTDAPKLAIVHSHMCGKKQVKSLGGVENFLTFTNDKTRYTWVYILKTKDQVFQWKALAEMLRQTTVENTPQTSYLTDEGIRQEKTIPKTPEQNGVMHREAQSDSGRVGKIHAPGCESVEVVLG